MSDVQGEPLKGTALYNAILERFRAVPDAEGRLDCEKLADAALQISAVYELVFGSGFISRHLKLSQHSAYLVSSGSSRTRGHILGLPIEGGRQRRPGISKDLGFGRSKFGGVPLACSCAAQQDIANSSGRMREAAKALRKSRGGSAVTADELIAWELKELGIPKMRKDQNSGVRGMLWMKRALDFVFSLICNTFGTMKDATVKECALDAYDRVLKPYHSFLVSNIVSLAFSLAPSKEEFVRRLGFEMDEAENCLGSIQEVVLPVIARLNTLLEEANCNFPDKA